MKSANDNVGALLVGLQIRELHLLTCCLTQKKVLLNFVNSGKLA